MDMDMDMNMGDAIGEIGATASTDEAPLDMGGLRRALLDAEAETRQIPSARPAQTMTSQMEVEAKDDTRARRGQSGKALSSSKARPSHGGAPTPKAAGSHEVGGHGSPSNPTDPIENTPWTLGSPWTSEDPSLPCLLDRPDRARRMFDELFVRVTYQGMELTPEMEEI
ncbi:MAG: hypothetical protein M1817_002058 [Caeruleum heppii]|nr:MAG: hypothetical protein M1817_002058 [Caeruleum heppii]